MPMLADPASVDDSCSIIAHLAQLEKDMYDQSCWLEGMLSDFSDRIIWVEDCVCSDILEMAEELYKIQCYLGLQGGGTQLAMEGDMAEPVYGGAINIHPQ